MKQAHWKDWKERSPVQRDLPLGSAAYQLVISLAGSRASGVFSCAREFDVPSLDTIDGLVLLRTWMHNEFIVRRKCVDWFSQDAAALEAIENVMNCLDQLPEIFIRLDVRVAERILEEVDLPIPGERQATLIERAASMSQEDALAFVLRCGSVGYGEEPDYIEDECAVQTQGDFGFPAPEQPEVPGVVSLPPRLPKSAGGKRSFVVGRKGKRQRMCEFVPVKVDKESKKTRADCLTGRRHLGASFLTVQPSKGDPEVRPVNSRR